jgi:hypothetical protein
VPQRPQLPTLLVTLVSQPSPALALQSPKPTLQVVPQVPAAQRAVALEPAAQTRPQAPQLATVVRRSTSQPLAATPSQLPKFVAQVRPQVPAEQTAVEFDPAGQALPQRPQWATVLCTSTSQPLVATPSQLPKPGVQLTPQVPVVHAGAEFEPEGQEVPQPPQWRGSLAVVTHEPLQSVVPVMHASMQAPAEQSRPAPQAVPQRPQWALSVRGSTHRPPQSTWPEGQAQAPTTQLWPPAQAVPQAPQ